MAPSWLPLCKAMQRNCEAYFSAVNSWKGYEDKTILKNRIQAIESIVSLFREYGINPNNFAFSLVLENHDALLLPEVFPSAGKHFSDGGDTQAYEAARKTISEKLFIKGGVFFQSGLLKAMAGWNADILTQSNTENRKSLIATVAKLLRVPENAGKVHLTIQTVTKLEGQVDTHGPVVVIDLKELSEPQGKSFYEFLAHGHSSTAPAVSHNVKVETNGAPNTSHASMGGKKRPLSASESKHVVEKKSQLGPKSRKVVENDIHKRRKQNSGAAVDDVEDPYSDEEEADDHIWTKGDPRVGLRVCAYFPPDDDAPKGTPMSLYYGDVHLYSQATKTEGELFHILWEDGDEEDYDTEQFEKGRALLADQEGGTTEHPSVGTRVAKNFPEGTGKKKTIVTFKGKVIRYFPVGPDQPTALYLIKFDDGDEEDFDEEQFEEAVTLYESAVANYDAAPSLEVMNSTTSTTSTSSEVDVLSAVTPVKASSSSSSTSTKKSAKKSTTHQPAAPSSPIKTITTTIIQEEEASSVAVKTTTNSEETEEVNVTPPTEVVAPEVVVMDEVVPEVVIDEVVTVEVTTPEEVEMEVENEVEAPVEVVVEEVHVEVVEEEVPTQIEPEPEVTVVETVTVAEEVKEAEKEAEKEVEKEEEKETVSGSSSAVNTPAPKGKKPRKSISSSTPSAATVESASISSTVNNEEEEGESLPTTPAPKSASKKNTSSKKGGERKEVVKDEEVEPVWIKNHVLLNTKVAKYFPCTSSEPHAIVDPSSLHMARKKYMRVFTGKVTKYAAPTSAEKEDQLFHILFEDGDEEDWEQDQLDTGAALYTEHTGKDAYTPKARASLFTVHIPQEAEKNEVDEEVKEGEKEEEAEVMAAEEVVEEGV